MDTKEIRSLIELMKKNGIAVFKMERENFKITLKTNEAGCNTQYVTSMIPQAQAYAAPMAAPSALPAAASESAAPATADASLEIKSPMVGTFYSSPSPDAPAFVSVGQTITPDTVVCIIEAMKVMNEIKAEVSGTVVEVCADNGKAVQFGQPLFRLK